MTKITRQPNDEVPESLSPHKPNTRWMRRAPEAAKLTDTVEPTPGARWVAPDWECWAVGVGDTAIASFENRADAMLDAAAPELLEACKLAEECTHKVPEGMTLNEAAQMVRTKLRDAIRKAEGGGA